MRRIYSGTGEIPVDTPPDAAILVVDDDPEIGETMARIFRPIGIRVTWCGTMADAAVEIARDPPDLVMLDVRLPDGDGLTLCRALKGRATTNSIPVIVLSGQIDPPMRIATIEAGADHILTKPPPRPELIARTVALLRARAVSRALEESRGELKLRRDWVRYLAHDLRNSLTLLLGNASILADAQMDAEQAQALADLTYELGQCRRMILDLLDTERLRDGRLEPQRREVDVAGLARDEVRGVRPLLQVHGIDVEYAGSASLEANVDPELVGRVFLNIFCNAARYAPQDSRIRVELSAPVAGEDGREMVSIAICNAGPPIPKEARERIFEPYVRLDENPGRGAGLGLAFCALAVKAHGGVIFADEPPGGGARFVIRLPLK